MDGNFQFVDLERVFPSFTNPRKVFDPVKLADLAESLKSKGMLQPVLVRPAPDFRLIPGRQSGKPGFLWESDNRNVLGGYAAKEADGEAVRPLELVAGERRWRAAKLAGLEQIPVVVRDLSDVDAIECQVVENDQRADVLPSERAAGYRALLKAGRSAEDVAARIGQSVSTVRGFLLLEGCPEDLLATVDAGKVGRTVAELVCRLPRHDQQDLAARCVLAGATDPADLSTRPHGGAYFGEALGYRQTKELVARHFQRELKGAPFKPADKKLLPGVGACTDCPKRAGNARAAEPEAFEGTRDDICLDPSCYREKCQAQERKDALKAQAAPPPAAANGRTPLPTVGSVNEWVGAMKEAGAQAADSRKQERAAARQTRQDSKADAALDERYDRLLLGELALSAEGLFGAVLPKGSNAINAVLRLVAAEVLEAARAMMVEDLTRERRGHKHTDDLARALAKMDGDQLVGLIVELTAAQYMDDWNGREKKLPALAKALEINPKDVEKRARKGLAAEAEPAPAAEPTKAGKAKGEPIEGLGVTAEQLDAAYVADRWMARTKDVVGVKAVSLNDKLYVYTGSWSQGEARQWRLDRLYPLDEFKKKFPDENPRLAPRAIPYGKGRAAEDEAREDFYFGTRVKVGKAEYVIGPRGESRTVVRQIAKAKPSANGHAGGGKPKKAGKRQPAEV